MTDRFETLVLGREQVGFESEFGIVHDPDTDCGSGHPTVAPETLDYDGSETHSCPIEGNVTRRYHECGGVVR